MGKALLVFGVGLAALVAVPVASVVKASAEVVEASFHPERRYQLTLELDGQYYISDFNMTRADCINRLTTVNDWTDGRANYRCDVQPIASGAK